MIHFLKGLVSKNSANLVSPTAFALYFAVILIGLSMGYSYVRPMATQAQEITRTFVGEAQIVNFVRSFGYGIGAGNGLDDSLRADNSTASKICELAGYATVSSKGTDVYATPGNNEIAYWNGETFITANAAVIGNPLHLDGLVCSDPINPTPVTNMNPEGYFDGSLSCGVVQGWACDPDNFNQALEIHIYDGPAEEGRILGTTVANLTREPLVGTHCAGNVNHGFQFALPAHLLNGVSHPIYAYAINIGAGNNIHLDGSPASVQCNATPSVPPTVPPTVAPVASPSASPAANTLTCFASQQTVQVGQTAQMTAIRISGAVIATWSAPEGTPSTGNMFTFNTTFSTPGVKQVTASNNGQTATCSITVVAAPVASPSAAPSISPTPTVVPGSNNPISFLDGAMSCQVIQGWACDPNDFGATLDIHLYDGPAELGRLVAVVKADQTREPMVGSFCGGTTNHGFSFAIPANLKDGLQHQIYAYAINVGAGNNIHIPNSPTVMQCTGGVTPSVTPVTPSPSAGIPIPSVSPSAAPSMVPTNTSAAPFGTLDGAVSCEVIQGWACDPDNFNAPVDIHLYDGPAALGRILGVVKAEHQREAGIGANCGGNRNHGFYFNIPTSLKDGQVHQIYGYGINLNGSNNSHLGGSPVTVQCGPNAARLIADFRGPQSATPGETISYTVNITNNGNATAPQIRVLDNVPAGLIFVQSGSTAGCIYDASQNQVQCPLFDYAVGDSRTFTLRFNVAASCGASVNNYIDIWGPNAPLARTYNIITQIFCDASPMPTVSVTPSVSPSASPSVAPSVSPSPSASIAPTVSPVASPSASPSVAPSVSPSAAPSVTPTASVSPSASPVAPITVINTAATGPINVNTGHTDVRTGDTNVDVRTGSQTVTINLPKVAGASTTAPAPQKVAVGTTTSSTGKGGIAVPITAKTGAAGAFSLLSTLMGGAGLSVILKRFI